jgi:hypothetical protein
MPRQLHIDFVNNYISKIDRTVRPSAYGLERGELFEKMVAETLGLYGISAAPYGQYFPANASESKREGFIGSRAFIKGYQRDLWVGGGTTGYRYPVEVKERRHPYGKSIFSYPDILVGESENWDIKNALTLEKPGYRGVLAIIIVDGRTGDIRATPTDLESQQNWLKVSKGHELSYAVSTNHFLPLTDFVEHLKLL